MIRPTYCCRVIRLRKPTIARIDASASTMVNVIVNRGASRAPVSIWLSARTQNANVASSRPIRI